MRRYIDRTSFYGFVGRTSVRHHGIGRHEKTENPNATGTIPMLVNAGNDVSCRLFDFRPQDVVLVGKPMSHAGGLQTQLMPALLVDASAVIEMKPSPATAVRTINEHSVTEQVRGGRGDAQEVHVMLIQHSTTKRVAIDAASYESVTRSREEELISQSRKERKGKIGSIKTILSGLYGFARESPSSILSR